MLAFIEPPPWVTALLRIGLFLAGLVIGVSVVLSVFFWTYISAGRLIHNLH